MVFVWGAIKVLIFALCAGVAVTVVILVPVAIYLIPYGLWVGVQNTYGRHKDKKGEKLSRSVRNATRLYKAWITRKEPNF